MKHYWLIILSFLCFPAYAQDSTIDGYDYTSAEMVEYHGIIGSPSTSATGYAKQYFDASSGKLKCSENGGAYADCVGGGSGGDASGWTDGGTNVYVTNTTENVAIGTTTPNATLKINNVTTSDSFRVDDSLLDATPFIITSTGNVGIGTTRPASPFQFGAVSASNFITMNTASAPAMAIRADSASTVDLLNIQSSSLSTGNAVDVSISSTSQTVPVVSLSTSGSAPSALLVQNSAAALASVVRFNDVASDTTPFSVDNTGNVGIGTITPNAQLDIRNQGVTPFMVNSGATVSTGDYLVVRSDGNVGIGTVSPERKLSLSGTSPDIRIRASTSNEFSEIQYWTDSGETFNFGVGGSTTTIPNEAYFENLTSGAPINFYTSGGSLTINGSGNVGIGSTAPDSILNIPSLQSTTGTRYLCIGTTGRVTSSAIACAGT